MYGHRRDPRRVSEKGTHGRLTAVHEIKVLWQGPSLDLIRTVHEETQHHDDIQTSGSRLAASAHTEFDG